ncbi:TetR/AcrR family transcriptional regulator [Prescottella agglutinans]|uniref:TetR/AcrR family transcriptional regulator n=1 Tax=Prescottella agglutinans TaxID=1644129 RepID=A0A3S3CW78_9NOCA|nr:TetR/AcrR family transcriptional regulator [Prescottella agglutinans]RVW07158.1 TetR/AcrR family transcriptional regulator [Prescottella agglutinans]
MGSTSGLDDAARTMARLWASPPLRDDPDDGASLTLEAIVDAATALADETGTAAVPLRAVGERLGCTAMALYTYVDGKDELLDVMYDRAHAGFTAAAPTTVTAWTERLLDLYVAHPWMLDLTHTRPALGPHQQEVFESLLATLLPTGIAHREVAAIASSAFSLTAAAARTIVDARRILDETNDDAGQRWAERMDALAAAAPDFAVRFPLSTALMDSGDRRDPDVAGPDDLPIMEHAARQNLRTSVELLLAGAERRRRD